MQGKGESNVNVLATRKREHRDESDKVYVK